MCVLLNCDIHARMDARLAEIDSARLSRFGQESEIQANDVYAYIVRVSQQTLFQLYKHSRKPIEAEVISAAALYFFRFFMKESPKDCNPRHVLVTCMNLAAKTEEYHSVTLSDLVNALPDANELKAAVPRLEMKLLAALEYDLVVEQPWLVVLFWADQLKSAQDDKIHLKVYDLACDYMRVWQFTDAVLIFPFPQLATAAVKKACQALSAEEDVEPLSLRMEGIFQSVIPKTDVADLLMRVESVATRFGPFDKVVKDPSVVKTTGYQKLESSFS